MKKTFKRAGVAVLSMAMILSMGAVGAMSASAADESVTVSPTDTGLKTGDKVTVYKVAAQNSSNVWGWTKEAYGTAAGVNFTTIDGYTDNSAETKALAAKLARTVTASDITASGTVGTAINLSTAGAGYYLVVAASSDAGKVAQPILVQVDGAETIRGTKVSTINLTKKITKVMEGSTDRTSSNVQDTGKNAQAKAGDVVTYRITAQIPSYDSAATSIQDFVLTDKSDDTLTSCEANDFKVIIGDNVNATTGTNVSSCLTRTDGQNFTVTLPGSSTVAGSSTVKNNGGKYLIVEFTATVGDNPTLSRNLGARDNQADTEKSADANKNDVTLTYGNNYSTGGGSDTDGDGDVDGGDEQPELKDYADVYATALYVDKTLNETAAAANDVGFELWDAAGTTKIRNEVMTDSDGRVSFKGLDAGTYTLKESTGKTGYKKVDDFTVTITSESPYATFAATGWTLETAGGLKKTVDNPLTESLPGTGGMGTVLFTVGGAAIVLLAGAMFVVYMRRRKNEE